MSLVLHFEVHIMFEMLLLWVCFFLAVKMDKCIDTCMLFGGSLMKNATPKPSQVCKLVALHTNLPIYLPT
jgi:hypothetical protein